MTTYYVTIQATITKTVEVDAEGEDAAEEAAHEAFSVLHDGTPETYSQKDTNTTTINPEG